MKKILTLLYTNFIMLTRQRGLIISSLGLAIISMLVFGFLFGGSGSPKTLLGVVDQDHSAISAQIVHQLQKSDALRVYTGSSDEEQQALKDGHRNAVIIIPPGFGQQMVQGGAHLQVFYDQGNPVTTAATQLTVKAIIDGINRAVTHQPGPVTLDQQAVAAKDIREIDIITPGMLGMLLMWANLAVGIQLVNWREMGIPGSHASAAACDDQRAGRSPAGTFSDTGSHPPGAGCLDFQRPHLREHRPAGACGHIGRAHAAGYWLRHRQFCEEIRGSQLRPPAGQLPHDVSGRFVLRCKWRARFLTTAHSCYATLLLERCLTPGD